ncbi:sugar transporter ERD6-like 16 [Spinacia oleracea]|uniref:Sugar transporter ERD6-like 16 n=1 Tax=Spinacia oleracea TaxID=3562 RepID=A0ABM3R3G9_SPIOL|nr:sugar transporter ERD6-like 16 [Spinacia oleracea]
MSRLFPSDIKGRVLIWWDYHGDVSAVQAKKFFTKFIEKESISLVSWSHKLCIASESEWGMKCNQYAYCGIGAIMCYMTESHSSYVVPIYIVEIESKNLRGCLGTLNQLMIVIGAATTFFSEQLDHTMYDFIRVSGYILESPRWLAKVGQMKRFEKKLRMLRGKDDAISVEASEIQIGVGLMLLQQLGGANSIGFYASEMFVVDGKDS